MSARRPDWHAFRGRVPYARRVRAALCAFVLCAAASIAPLAASDQGARAETRAPWNPDNGDGTYKNPVLHADYSDPDVIRVRGRYYMVSSSFAHTPAIPVLESRDLVNWKIIGHVAENLPSPMFDRPQHGKGVWAPSIRFHNNEFYVYFGDPDLGIFMAKAKHAAGPWQPLTLVKKAKGWIDPCPFWDEDGKAYLVHAWAKSRAGFNSVLTVNRMNAAGTKILDEGKDVFDGHKNHPTIEGPKFYKRNGWYYLFAPAGGVKPGWQTVLRSKHVYGPYEDRIAMDQGSSPVNGPHQGAWVEDDGGEDWFIHFQDRGPYGRIVHLQPMLWKNDWPVIGKEQVQGGKGEPVLAHAKPHAGGGPDEPVVPQTSDEFSSPAIGLQWQWLANHQQRWYSLSAHKGMLRLFTVPMEKSDTTLWTMPNLLLQKFPAPSFTVTTRLDTKALGTSGRAGLIVFGLDYASIDVRRSANGMMLKRITCMNARDAGKEEHTQWVELDQTHVDLRVSVDTSASCLFSFSTDGTIFVPLGERFSAREGLWVGAKVGIYAVTRPSRAAGGYAEYDFFRFE